MHARVNQILNAVAAVIAVIFSPLCSLVVLRWIWLHGSFPYPFFYIVCYTALEFIASVAYFVYGAATNRALCFNASRAYLKLGDHLITFVPHISYHFFMVLAVVRTETGVLAMLSGIDQALVLVLGKVLLKRKVVAGQIVIATLMAVTGFIYLLVSYTATGGFEVNRDVNWLGIVFFIISRVCFALRGVASKRLLLRRAKERQDDLMTVSAAAKNGSDSGDEVVPAAPTANPAAAAAAAAASFQQHIFTGFPEGYLARLDEIFASPLYDSVYLSVDVTNTAEMELSGTLGLLPIAMLASFFNNSESPSSYNEIANSPTASLVIPLLWLTIATVSCLPSTARVALHTSSTVFVGTQALSVFAAVFGAAVFLTGERVTVVQFVCLFVLVSCIMWYRRILADVASAREARDDVQKLQVVLPRLTSVDVDVLCEVHNRFGEDPFDRVAVDAAVVGGVPVAQLAAKGRPKVKPMTLTNLLETDYASIGVAPRAITPPNAQHRSPVRRQPFESRRGFQLQQDSGDFNDDRRSDNGAEDAPLNYVP